MRFPTSLSSTQAIAGGYDPRWFDVTDADGITLAQNYCAISEVNRMRSITLAS